METWRGESIFGTKLSVGLDDVDQADVRLTIGSGRAVDLLLDVNTAADMAEALRKAVNEAPGR